MPLFVPRKRAEICEYQKPEEKLNRYRNRIFPEARRLRTIYDVIAIARDLGKDDLVLLPGEYNFFPDMTSRQFMRYGPTLWLAKKEADFVKEVKRVLNVARPSYLPRGLSWGMGDSLAVYPFVCGIDGLVLTQAFEGDMAAELFQLQELPRERVKVTPNYRENNIVARVPSRSLADTKVHIVTIHNPPTKNSQFEWHDTYLKHVCGDTTYNKELNVGSKETAIEEHDVGGLIAGGKFLAQQGNPFKSNFVLPITKDVAVIYKRLVNQFLKLDPELKPKRKTGKGSVRNLREGERELAIEAYVRTRQQSLRRRASDVLLLDSLEDLEEELRKDNYILEILYPS